MSLKDDLEYYRTLSISHLIAKSYEWVSLRAYLALDFKEPITAKLTILEARILAALLLTPDCSIRELAIVTRVQRVAASRAVQRLLNADLIEKRINDADNRLITLRVNERGRKICHFITPRILMLEETLVRNLESEEVEQLRGLLIKMLSAEGAERPFLDKNKLPYDLEALPPCDDVEIPD